MKKTLLVAAAAALCMAASSAFAQSYDPDLGTGDITQWYDNGNNLHPNPSSNAPYYGDGPYAQLFDAYYDYGPGIFYDPRVIERRCADAAEPWNLPRLRSLLAFTLASWTAQ